MLRQSVGESEEAEADGAEAARLEAIHQLDVLDSHREEGFDRIVRLVKAIFHVPMAFVSVIDAHRLWFKACEGVDGSEIARDDTFCKYVIKDPRPLVVPDTLRDPRFSSHPAVLGPPHVRFYAGVPLRNPDGHTIGTVCAMDTQPRQFGAEQLAILSDLARVTMAEFELRQIAAIDVLTGVMSRRAFREAATDALALAQRYGRPLSMVAFDLDHFKQINDTRGHAAGDKVLAEVGRACLGKLRQVDAVGRIGGEEFAVLLPETGPAAAMKVAEKLRAAIRRLRIDTGAGELAVTASFGVASLDRETTDVDALLAHADAALYRAKAAGRNRAEAWQPPAGASRATRRRVLKAGQILFGNRMSTVDCTVRSLGEDGAGLDVSSTMGIPERFTLVIRSDGLDKPCRTVAQTDRHLEVDFD